MLKVKKSTGPLPNKRLPNCPRWKTYDGKFVTFKKGNTVYYVHFQYGFFKGIHDISVVAFYEDDKDIKILDFLPAFPQRLMNQIDTLYAVMFPRIYEKRHPTLFSTKQ